MIKFVQIKDNEYRTVRADEEDIAFRHEKGGGKVIPIGLETGEVKDKHITENSTEKPNIKKLNKIRKEEGLKPITQEKMKANQAKEAKETPKPKRDLGSTDTSDRNVKFESATIKTQVPGDLLCQHTDENGKLTAEREQLHEEIVLKHLEGIQKAEGQPVFTVLGGGSAAGKSTFTNDPANGFTDKSTFVKVDSDNIKKMLPEYAKLKSEKNEDAAAFAHEESSALAKRTMSVAQTEGYNVMLDGTGDGSVKGMLKKIDQAHEKGMRVEGVYCTVDLEMALERSDARAKNPKSDSYGRVVPHSTIASTHIKVSQILPQIASKMDSCRLYDTSGKKAVLIAEGGAGKDLTPVKGREKDWEKFLAKGNLKVEDYQ